MRKLFPKKLLFLSLWEVYILILLKQNNNKQTHTHTHTDTQIKTHNSAPKAPKIRNQLMGKITLFLVDKVPQQGNRKYHLSSRM